jgi:hypothetical protein
MMIEGMVPVYSFVGWRDQASRILELLLVSLNEEARQEARYTINALIERRFIEFRALLFRESREFS